MLYLNDQYGRGIRQTFVERVRPARRPARSRSIPTSATSPTSARTSTAWPGTSAIEFLVVAGNRGEAEEIIRQARRRGLTMPVLGGDGLEGIEEAGALAEGVYLSSPYFPTLPTEANRKFVEAFRQQVPRRRACPTSRRPATYDAIYLLRDVIARAGTEPRRRCARALAGVGSATPAVRGRHRHRRVRRRRRRARPERLHRAGARRRGRGGQRRHRRRAGTLTMLRSLREPRDRRHGAADRPRLRASRCSASTRSARSTTRSTRSCRSCSRAPTSATAWSPRSPSEIRSAEQYLVRPGDAAAAADDRGGRLGLRLPAPLPRARLAHHLRPLHRQQDRRQPGPDRSGLRAWRTP